jgi:hypothetical protein
MTKKFWKDWENRVGETRNIYLFYHYQINDCDFKRIGCCLLNTNDRIIDAKFNKDSVDLVIERHREIININGRHWHIQNEKITLKREDIAKIEFQK